ncbi:SDR family oxidoreductase [Candidatus Gracilibacteria bacterium]|nr:SDR family oxidoreductase [Candidatus Gracilibacteria bacterium]
MEKILITGTSSGIGKFLAEKFSAKYKIFGISRRKISECGEKFFGVEKNFFEIKGDLKKNSEIEKKILKLKKNFSDGQEDFYFDKIILNAGIGYFENFETMQNEEIFEILQVNLLANIFLVKFFLDEKLIKKGGKIIFIGSKASKKFGKNGAVYIASKFGLRGFAGGLQKDLGRKIGIHLINTKVVKTNFHKNSKTEIQGKFAETQIEKIFGACEEIFDEKEVGFEVDL